MLPPQVLIVAGSDSGGGAGIQADLKAVHASGAYALTAITAVTAQNTVAVTRAFDLPADVVRAQIDAVFDDFDVAAVKTGMLSSVVLVETVASALAARGVTRLVVDPVMISKSGHALLADDAVEALRARVLPLAAVVTPNRLEAERLAGLAIRGRADVLEAGRRLLALGSRAAVIKGGHLEAAPGTDFLFHAGGVTEIEGEWIETRSTHGTGCTFASAIAAHLARGADLIAAVRAAKHLVTDAIRHGLALGHGYGPTDPFWRLGRSAGQ
ncbi:MAG: bifunctional hydroxymethylpyrimidine kinase/phosphomethylpyrimidine kinase [Planctomycetes bacterium]|nr:bifunctional hydroxymethylpyrimidine kinase/phosphomethylpyrimidine kinase [Planctomycetota bacterium]